MNQYILILILCYLFNCAGIPSPEYSGRIHLQLYNVDDLLQEGEGDQQFEISIYKDQELLASIKGKEVFNFPNLSDNMYQIVISDPENQIVYSELDSIKVEDNSTTFLIENINYLIKEKEDFYSFIVKKENLNSFGYLNIESDYLLSELRIKNDITDTSRIIDLHGVNKTSIRLKTGIYSTTGKNQNINTEKVYGIMILPNSTSVVKLKHSYNPLEVEPPDFLTIKYTMWKPKFIDR